MTFLRTIKELRKAKGLSQTELSDISGLDRAALSRVESDKTNASVSTLESIAAALDAEFVLVPRRSLGAVRSVISEHLSHDRAQTPSKVTSVRDELFIPDDFDDDEEPEYRGPRI